MTFQRSFAAFFQMASGELFSKVFGFLTTIYLARTLGIERFGEYSWVMAAFSYLYMLGNFGIETFGTREIARQMSAPLISSLMVLRSIYVGLILCILVLVWTFLPSFNSLLLWQACSLIVLPLNTQYIFRGIQQAAYDGLSRALQAMLFMALVLTVVHSEENRIVPWLWFVSALIANAVFYRAMVERTGYRFHIPTSADLKHAFTSSLPVGIASLLTLVYLNLDTVLLGFFLDYAAVGYYSVAFKIYFFGYSLISLFYIAFLPSLSRPKEYGYRQTLRAYRLLLGVAAAGILCMAVMFSSEIITLLYSDQYSLSSDVLCILLSALSLSCLNFALINPLQASGRDGLFLKLLSFRTGIFVILCTILIPKNGIFGAAWATVAAESLTLMISLVTIVVPVSSWKGKSNFDSKKMIK